MVDAGRLFHPPLADRALQADVTGCALLGPVQSGKTNLAFTYAVNVALAGGKALFICHRPKMEACPFLLPAGLSQSAAAPALQAIGMKYLETDAQICQYLLALHLLAPEEAPELIVVDDWGTFFQEGTRFAHHGVLRCLALLNETVQWLARRDRRCSYLLVDDLDGPLHQAKADRWLPLSVCIEGLKTGARGGTHCLRLHRSEWFPTGSAPSPVLHYALSADSLQYAGHETGQ